MERYGSSRLVGVADNLQRMFGHAAVIDLAEDVAVLADFGNEGIGERVDARDADAVQARRNFIAAGLVAAAELAAGVEVGESELDTRYALLLVDAGGNAAAVIPDDAAAVFGDGDVYSVAISRESFVYGVIDNFPYEGVKAAFIGGADVHAGMLPYGLQTFERLEAVRIVIGIDFFGHFAPLF